MENKITVINLSKDELKEIISECIEKEVVHLNTTLPESNIDTLITEKDLSLMLQKSKVTLNKWRSKGLIPFYRISNKIYYKWDEVLESLKKVDRS